MFTYTHSSIHTDIHIYIVTYTYINGYIHTDIHTRLALVENDLFEIVRDPMKTRPLSLNNSDNKVVVIANVKQLTQSYNQITHKFQNVFYEREELLNNIVDMDTSGKIYSMFYQLKCKDMGTSCIPVMPAFDFLVAFP